MHALGEPYLAQKLSCHIGQDGTSARLPGQSTQVEGGGDFLDGRMFTRADPPIYRGRGRAARFDASIDRIEDPHDVYRVKVRAHSRVRVTAKPLFGHITLRALSPGARSLSQRRRVVARSARPGKRTERLTIVNRSRNARTFFVAIDVPNGLLLNAAYRLTARR